MVIQARFQSPVPLFAGRSTVNPHLRLPADSGRDRNADATWEISPDPHRWVSDGKAITPGCGGRRRTARYDHGWVTLPGGPSCETRPRWPANSLTCSSVVGGSDGLQATARLSPRLGLNPDAVARVRGARWEMAGASPDRRVHYQPLGALDGDRGMAADYRFRRPRDVHRSPRVLVVRRGEPSWPRSQRAIPTSSCWMG
jgi:hypothetical protein